MWPTNPLTDRLGIDVPIIQAPMAGPGTPELSAAVSNAGGLGSLGLGASPPDVIDRQLADHRRSSNRPLNANFFCHEDPGDVSGSANEMRERLQPWYDEKNLGPVPPPSVPYQTFGEAHVALIRNHRPQVVSFHFGLPAQDHLDAVRETGAVILGNATTVAEALWLERRGTDAIIAQGMEAGGHRGTFQGADISMQPGLFALLPQIATAVDVPVIAAGGIVDGRTIAAAMMLGADAVQIGTAFLRCPEANTPAAHRAALQGASDDGTRITRLFSGKPARGLRNRLTDDYVDAEADAAPYPSQISLIAPLRTAASETEARDTLPLWSGQSAALTREMPAADLVRVLAEETERHLKSFA
ncbi:MAG: NAD(P)H-dependent flavin oxidoreductase [Hyphomicrobiales bacterium]